jgi:hypothetical protein
MSKSQRQLTALWILLGALFAVPIAIARIFE